MDHVLSSTPPRSNSQRPNCPAHTTQKQRCGKASKNLLHGGKPPPTSRSLSTSLSKSRGNQPLNRRCPSAAIQRHQSRRRWYGDTHGSGLLRGPGLDRNCPPRSIGLRPIEACEAPERPEGERNRQKEGAEHKRKQQGQKKAARLHY